MLTAQSWRAFLIDLELARNYPIARVNAFDGPARNPVLDELLPGLLLVKAVAILDAGIEEYTESRGLSIPRKPYGTGLKGRIDFLVDQGVFTAADDIHRIRDVRNVIAHEARGAITWASLDGDIATLESALRTLGLVGPRPDFVFFAERAPIDKPEHPGAIFGFAHVFGVKEGDRIVSAVESNEYVLRDDA